MRTDELIQRLAAEAGPVRRLRPISVRVLGWLVLALVSLGVVMLLMGVRRELGDSIDRADFALEAALLIVTALSAAIGALVASVPGAERTALVRWLPITTAAAGPRRCRPDGSGCWRCWRRPRSAGSGPTSSARTIARFICCCGTSPR